jgi:uncharacterized protein
MSGTVPGDLLEILVCPACKGDLALQARGDEHEALDCAACGLRYPIEEGIPVMLVEEARRLDASAHS